MPNSIIACIDGSAATRPVCNWAAWASRLLQAPLTLLHVLDKPTRVEQTDLSGAIGLGAREDLLEQLTRLDEARESLALAHGKEMLAAARQQVEQDGAFDVTTRQRHGELEHTLAELESHTGLFVMGRKGEHSENHLSQIGSHLESVIRTLHCPILVALQEFKAPRAFLLAYDGSPTADKALAFVIASPLLKSLSCHLVMVGNDQHGKLVQAEQRLSQAGLQTEACSLPGDNIGVINDYAQERGIDLILMGAYGHSRMRRFFVGSNTGTLLRETRTPLLLIR